MRAHDDPEEPTAPPGRRSHRFGAPSRIGTVPNFERLHHILRGRVVFLEMNRLEMGLIRIYVGVQLEDEDIWAVGQNGRIVRRKRAVLPVLAHPPSFRRDTIAQSSSVATLPPQEWNRDR
jgi:hypothetical protein